MQKFQEEDQILFEAIEAYRNGDGDKATFIYESTKKYTYKILHQEVERFKSQSILTGDAISITEDVMQDLYIDFFNKIDKFRNEDPRSIFKWISVVAHRMLLDYVDKNKMEVLQFEKNEDYREENDIWDSSEINDSDMESNHELLPEAALEDKEFRELILDFIQSLPEAQAQTILLHFRGGMKYQEIADEMGVSLITVKTRMKKAKDSLEDIITKYEKKTGTKLHSVSVLPLLWLLYRMASEDTTVPVAVDAAVTSLITGASSVAGASGVGIGGATTTAVTKAISTRVLVAIVSTAVTIGGVAVGSQLIDKKQETTIEQGDSEDKELDNKQDSEGSDGTSSEGDADTENDETLGSDANNQPQGENNGSDTLTNNNGTGENSNGTGSNTNNSGTGNNSGTQGNTNNSGNDSGNSDSGNESTAAKGTKENPYRIGEKIVVTDDISYHSSENNPSVYHLEMTVTDYTPIEQAEPVYVQSMNNTVYLNVVKAKIKIIGEGTEAYSRTPIGLGLVESNGNGYGWSGEIFDQSGKLMNQVYNNVEYDIGFHYSTSAYQEGKDYIYFEILFSVHGEKATQYIYVKLE